MFLWFLRSAKVSAWWGRVKERGVAPTPHPPELVKGATSLHLRDMNGTRIRRAIALSLVVGFVQSGCGDDPAAAPNRPPAVSIASPAEGATFTVGDSIGFEGTANDPEDGTLVAGSLVWTSSTAGEIGMGSSFSRNDLSIGAHKITLTATDTDGATSSASKVIRIEPEL